LNSVRRAASARRGSSVLWERKENAWESLGTIAVCGGSSFPCGVLGGADWESLSEAMVWSYFKMVFSSRLLMRLIRRFVFALQLVLVHP
jgi:hypothetical protein